jgi:hypothetical protein
MLVVFLGIVSGCIFTVCSQATGGVPVISLETYQNIGAGVAAREGSVDYDCSNFSTQFYQNCYKAGLPCRVRFGISGGSYFTAGAHAWNSVKIDGVWVNWEPQLNAVYNDHTQTWTSMGQDCTFVEEDIARIIYENIGKYVPKNIIDTHEIDTYWDTNSPFYVYFIPYAYCLSTDYSPAVQDLVSELEDAIPDNNSGGIFITEDKKHLLLFFKYNNKYYGIQNLEAGDPLEGRNIITKELSLEEIIASNTKFTKLNVDIKY